jgi:hypothetical protein
MFISKKNVLVNVPGRNYSQMPMPDRGRMPRVVTHADTTSGSTAHSHPEAAVAAEPATDPPDFTDDVFITPQVGSENVDEPRKTKAQWSRWMNEVIPSLLSPHLSLLRQSGSLRSISRSISVNCTC